MIRQHVVRQLRGAFLLLAALALPAGAQALQVGQITGTVTHAETGEPLSAVQVALPGTGLGVVTAANGQFTVTNVPAGAYALTGQRLGFQAYRQEDVTVTAGQTTTLNFQLRPTVLALQEIVATGLVDPVEGVRSPISVARVTRETMPVAVAGSAIQNLQGQVAGLSMARQSGQPGADVTIQLRTPTMVDLTTPGQGNERDTNPLIVVDGVILGSNTTNIEALDIESIEVIRGAAAASLYGSRAAAGVISITTNRGSGLEQGQTLFSARTELGISEAIRMRQVRHHPGLFTREIEAP